MMPRSLTLSVLLLCPLAAVAAALPQEAVTTQSTAENTNDTVTLTRSELEELVEGAVARRLRPLQRELTDFKESARFHDILGGIGYIVGIAGISFYFLGVRRKERLAKQQRTDDRT
jgi:nickel transport protein